MESLDGGELVLVMDLANHSGHEVVHIVLMGDEKRPIVSFCVVELFPQSRGPKRRSVRPISDPLLVAPGVSEPQQLHFRLVLPLVDRDLMN